MKEQKLNSNKSFIFSFIGTIVYHMGMGAILPFGSFSVYIISYYKEFDNSISLYYGYFLIPLITFALACFNALGGVIERKVGLHLTWCIGSVIMLIANTVMYFSKNIWTCYGVMFIYGLGSGVAMMAPTKNLIFYKPNKKGWISSGIASSTMLSTVLFAVIGESIINPTNYTLQKNESFYNYKIAKNFQKYIFYIFLIIPIAAIISIPLITVYKHTTIGVSETSEAPNETSEENTIPSSVQNNNESNSVAVSSTEVNKNIKDNPKPTPNNDTQNWTDKVSDPYKQALTQIFSNRRIWIWFTINFLTSFIYLLNLNTFKTIGTIRKMKTVLLKYTGAATGLSMCFLGPLWGVIVDCVGFKPVLMWINIVGMIISILLIISLKFELLFCGWAIFGASVITGSITAFNPHLMKVYGIKYMTELGGIVGLASGISNCMGSIFAFIISFYFEENTEISYSIIYISGGVWQLISLVFVFFESDKEFVFKDINGNEVSSSSSDDFSTIKKDIENLSNNILISESFSNDRES